LAIYLIKNAKPAFLETLCDKVKIFLFMDSFLEKQQFDNIII